ncbi:hypothetical protein [Prevotella rectalis]|uniref:hypothetical protein n=1 Tax=Prevotella rectalis TaxID=2219999 RepID=UPI002107C952|nr:hypothetical protein [Prevotella brunnea]
MTGKENEKKIPRYKRQLRYLCRQASNGWKLRDRIDQGNQWALENRKTFFALVVGILGFAFATTAISIVYDLTRDKSSDNIDVNINKQENSIEDISPMMNGLRQIEETKKTTKLEFKQVTDKGVSIHRELDSLLAIKDKSHEDSVRIVQDYRQLQRIVNFLKKGK